MTSLILHIAVGVFWGLVLGIPVALIVHAYRVERRS